METKKKTATTATKKSTARKVGTTATARSTATAKKATTTPRASAASKVKSTASKTAAAKRKTEPQSTKCATPGMQHRGSMHDYSPGRHGSSKQTNDDYDYIIVETYEVNEF